MLSLPARLAGAWSPGQESGSLPGRRESRKGGTGADRSMFDAFRRWRKGKSKDAIPTRDPVTPEAVPPGISPADNQRLARFHLWLRDEIERLSTAPGVAEQVRALFNCVFPDRPELATRTAAKALLAAQTGARRNYSYAFDLDGEIVAVSVSVSCQAAAAFLRDVRTGAYLKFVADAAAML